MEYFIGASITLLVIIVGHRFLSAKLSELNKIDIVFTQSHAFEITKPWIHISTPKKEAVGQSYNYLEKYAKRVVLVKDMAYWIESGSLVSARVEERSGAVDYESKKRVDTMSMDAVELNTVSYIVEKLTEGRNDEDLNSGNQGI